MDQKKIGEFISKLRKEKGFTQANLGEILGVSNRTVSKWENGDGMPDVSMLQELSNVLDITVDELLSGEKKELAELKVTEIQSKSKTENLFEIMYIISLFLAAFSAILSFVTLAYNIWAFNILFYNHWEIIFVAMALVASVVSALSFSIGVTKLRLSYDKTEIFCLIYSKCLKLIAVNSILPYMFVLRIFDVSRFGNHIIFFAVLLAIIFLIALCLARRVFNEKSK